jgi:hypothetical protein
MSVSVGLLNVTACEARARRPRCGSILRCTPTNAGASIPNVVKGPGPEDRDFFTGAIGADGYGRFFIYRGGSGICVRPHRHALARTLATSRGADDRRHARHRVEHLLYARPNLLLPDGFASLLSACALVRGADQVVEICVFGVVELKRTTDSFENRFGYASAAVFSSTRATRFVPGIGAMSSPWTSSHAMAPSSLSIKSTG